MVQKLEAIRGGGGSVRVGTVGTVGSLMTRELEASRPASHGTLKPRKSVDEVSSSDMRTSIKHRNPEVGGRTRGQTQHRISVISAATSKRQKQKAPLDDLGNSPLCKGTVRRALDSSSKMRTPGETSYIPMLSSENIHLDRTPTREKPTRRGASLAHVVDVRCGNSTVSLSNRLKKLGFSKLSQSFM